MTDNDFNQYRELKEFGAMVDVNPTVQGYKDLFQAQGDHLKKFREAGYAARRAECERKNHQLRVEAMYVGNKAYNKGLWNAIPWYKKPLYFMFKKPEDPTDI